MKNKVLSFIDEVNKEKQTIDAKNAHNNSLAAKQAVLNTNMDRAKKECLEYIFADVYKNAIPLDSRYVVGDAERVENQMKDFINRQTADKGIECYVREAIKRGNKSMAGMMEAVERFVEACYKEQKKDLPKIDSKALNWRFDDEKKIALNDIAKDANLDEVSSYIRKNVSDSVELEKQRVAERRQTEKDLQEELNSNNEMTSESALDQYLYLKGKKEKSGYMYQPSLFEGVMIHSFNHGNSETDEGQLECYNEAVCEYTLLCMNKALRVQNYSLSDVKGLAKKYANT